METLGQDVTEQSDVNICQDKVKRWEAAHQNVMFDESQIPEDTEVMCDYSCPGPGKESITKGFWFIKREVKVEVCQSPNLIKSPIESQFAQ